MLDRITEEALSTVVARVEEVQDALGRQILLENVSSYLTYHASDMSEWEFLAGEVAQRADCAILLDINNIYVSSVNHGFDAVEYLHSMPKNRVRQFHLAGHSDVGGHLIDTHDHPIVEPVWNPVSRGPGALRRRAHHDRAGRQHPGTRRTRGRAQDRPRHRRASVTAGCVMPLRELQAALQSHLLGEKSSIAGAIWDSPPLPAADRLAIYRNAYQVRLIDALDATYPVLHSLLGDEVFVALGEAFVAAHPSVHRSIRWYGGELASFLGRHEPYAEQPILAELALLE